MKDGKEIQLNIGCGVHLLGGFINVDKYHTLEEIKAKKGVYEFAVIDEGAEYVQGDILDLPFSDNYADYIECLNMIEHIPFLDVKKAISEMRRVLKPKGVLILFTNNFDDLVRIWSENVLDKDLDAEKYRDVQDMIYGSQAGEGEFHKTAFNPQFMNYILQLAGFTDFKMVLYPQYCTEKPPFRGAQPAEGMGARSGMIFVEATK